MTYGARVPLKNIKIEQQALFFTKTVRYTIHDTQGEPNWQALTDKQTVQMIFMTVNSSHKQRGQATKIVVQ